MAPTGFDPDGTPLDDDLKSELAKLPTRWQLPDDKTPHPVRLLDPNHWYELVPVKREVAREFKTQLRESPSAHKRLTKHLTDRIV